MFVSRVTWPNYRDNNYDKIMYKIQLYYNYYKFLFMCNSA